MFSELKLNIHSLKVKDGNIEIKPKHYAVVKGGLLHITNSSVLHSHKVHMKYCPYGIYR